MLFGNVEITYMYYSHVLSPFISVQYSETTETLGVAISVARQAVVRSLPTAGAHPPTPQTRIQKHPMQR